VGAPSSSKEQFASFAVLCEPCANVSLFLERIPIAQSSQRTAKLAASGWFLRRERPYRSLQFLIKFSGTSGTAMNGRLRYISPTSNP
jgi:hypothetical protein